MEVTNIKEAEPQKESLLWSVAKWFAVWLVVYTVVGLYGGLFRSSPQDIPAGMSWVNEADAASSTFYILRGGPHLILELNAHSQRYVAMLLTGLAVLFMYILSQALQGKLKNKRGELLPGYGQQLMAALAVGMVILILWYGMGRLLQKESLDLDPAADAVTLNGDHIGSFRKLSLFRAYTTRGSKGGINYHIVMEVSGGSSIPIGGDNAHGDVDAVAAYLNAYLKEVRANPSSP